jgi:hypothetical protein
MRTALRFGCAMVALAGLAACVTNDPYTWAARATSSGSWRVERTVDRVTGAPISSAQVITSQVSNGAIAFPPAASLQITCFKDEPLVRLGFGFRVGSNRNSTLGYRFDDKPGREAEARFLADYRTVVIEDAAEVAQFVRELASSQVLYVRIRSLNASRTSAEFRVSGAPGAIEAGLAGCPVKSANRTAEAGR